MPVDSVKNPLERSKEEDYYSALYKDIDVKSFLKKPIKEMRPKSAAGIDIPDIKPDDANKEPEGAKPAVAPAPPAAAPPKAAIPPVPPAMPKPPEPPKQDPAVPMLIQAVKEMKAQLDEIKSFGGIDGVRQLIMTDVDKFYKELKSDIENLEERKTPERGTFDTEGAYREHLYSMAVRMLDEFLPELVDDIPDYSLIASQVSRMYEDGTVADGMIKINVRVARGTFAYDFTVDVPILNGILHYPMYLQRGQKIIPLTKNEILEELESISFMKIDVDTTYSQKKNLFNNMGDNPNRRPDTQKWYEVEPNKFKPVAMPPQQKWQNQRNVR